MAQPNKSPRKRRSPMLRATELNKFLDTVRMLDRTVVEISMNFYRVPARDRAAMRAQHRRLHDIVRKHVPRFLNQLETDQKSFLIVKH